MLEARAQAGFASDAAADEAVTALWCAQPHAPASCADWGPEFLDDASAGAKNLCGALLEVELGYAERRRTNPSFAGVVCCGWWWCPFYLELCRAVEGALCR